MRSPPTHLPNGRAARPGPVRGWSAAGLLLWALVVAVPAGAAPPPAGSQILNRAEASYQPVDGSSSEAVYSNVVAAEIEAVEALTLDADQTVIRPVGSTAVLPHLLVNTGNVSSGYRLQLVNLGGDAYDLAGLGLFHDRNGNGVPDPDEPALPFDGVQVALTLGPGESASLLVTGGVPMGASGSARVQLTATTDAAPSLSAANTDEVRAENLASVVLTKTADQAGVVFPGTTVRYQVTASNIGDRPAGPTSTVAPAGTPLLIDGQPASVFLITDPIPAGSVYVPGSLSASQSGATRVYRLPSDPPNSYRTNGDDIAAVEVGVALGAFQLAPGVTTDLRFAVRVRDGYTGQVVNVARSLYNDGAASAISQSNVVVLDAPTTSIGLAKRATAPVLAADPATGQVTTASVTFSFVLQNFGSTTLQDAQVRDLLEGASRFGRYTSAGAPGPGEYTIVPGSGQVIAAGGPASGSFSTEYDGTASHPGLLQPGAVLPPGAWLEISFALRMNVVGRSGRIENRATGEGRPAGAGSSLVTDQSVDGSLPDRNGNADPADDESPTAVDIALPQLTLDKAASAPRRIAGDGLHYAVEYALTVSNGGSVPATYVQLVDNLECAFGTEATAGAVRSWRLAGTPVAERGVLVANVGYTGAAPCSGAGTPPAPAWASNPALTLTDGTRPLAPGASEVIRYTVEFELDPAAPAAQRTLVNSALALSTDDAGGGVLLATARDDVAATPIDPRGVVYDSVTREPLAGVQVTLFREQCDGAPADRIDADQLAPVPGVGYIFNADGSVSMVTGVDGAYAFALKYPPISATCRYRIALQPPPGASYVWPSSALPPSDGLAPGGFVQPQATAPTGDASTLYYLRFNLGPGLPEVLNNHVPLDPVTAPTGLVLEKTGSRQVAETGDTIDYRLRLGVAAASSVSGVRIVDRLPPGFRYVRGSARLGEVPLPDPVGAPGPELTFELPGNLEPAETAALVSYRAVVGVNAPLGPAINRATAYSSDIASNEAAWRVRVEGGVFSDEAYLVGKVFLDGNRDGVQGHEEVGIPGVRLLLEDGTSVVTDVEGKYSLYGLRAITHVIKLDVATLPEGARPLVVDHRNAGRADSRFVDLKKGELHKANFAIEDCCTTGVRDEVERRRKALAFRPDAEGEAVTRARLELEDRPEPTVQEARTRGSTGELTPSGIRAVGTSSQPARVPVFDPLLGAGDTRGAPTRLPDSPAGALPVLDLEAAVAGADGTLGFVGLADGDTLPMALTHVQVKGHLGSTLRLTVNGREEGTRRVGKRVRDAARQLEAWQYIGVELVPGKNELRVEELDAFGNVRDSRTIHVVAPGAIGRIEVEAPRTAVADATTAVAIRVRLTDDRGTPVTVRAPLTLEAEAGRWQAEDLDPDEPGTQVFIAGGEAVFALVPPNEPQDVHVQVHSGAMLGEAQVAFLPELRPLVGAGVLEGVIDLRGKGAVPLAASEAFEQELRNLSHSSGDVRATARAAFYFKGAVRGEYLLTAAYDSDKDTRERLFRDIQPDRFYPVYGDSAVKTFDAQSTQRLYLRIDRQRSYLLYGDFASDPTDETRRLSVYNRALTGIRLHHESDRVSANAFGSRDNLRQVVVELPADGTSGPYYLRGAGQFYENSERVEILVRDRNQPSIVLQVLPMARFADYVIEPLSRRLLFKAPVASLDAELNPRSIRVTYEADQGGPQYWTVGADARVKVHERVELGASYVQDDNGENPLKLAGVTAVVRPTTGTAIVAELAHSDSGQAGPGQGGRVEWLKQDGDLRVRAQVTTAGRSFDNAGAGFTGGRTEATVLATYQLDGVSSLRADAQHSRDAVAGTDLTGALLTYSRHFAAGLTAETGVRVSNGSGASSGSAAATPPVDVLALHARLATSLAWLKDGQAYLEGDQDLRESGKRMVAVGADYPLAARTRLYGRYEFISSLGNPYALGSTQQDNVALIGIESGYLRQGRLFSEFRMRDSIGGREAQAASGVRNTWTLREGLNVGASLEHTAAFGGVAGNESTAATTSVEYSGSERYRLYGSLEGRQADAGDAYLNTLGLSLKLDKDWSLLARSAISLQDGTADGARLVESRQQVGLAWRQVDVDRWNALARYEYSVHDRQRTPDAAREDTHVVSMNANYQPGRDLQFTARYAFKWGRQESEDEVSRFWAHLLYCRVAWDFAPKWDLSPQVAYRLGQHGDGSHAVGLEIGHGVIDNLWLSAGYNIVGIDDAALAGADPLARGGYLRVRFKFDEGLLR